MDGAGPRAAAHRLEAHAGGRSGGRRRCYRRSPGIFLLEVTPLRLAIAAIIAAAGALLVELTHRSIVLLVRRASADTGLAASIP